MILCSWVPDWKIAIPGSSLARMIFGLYRSAEASLRLARLGHLECQAEMRRALLEEVVL